MLTRLLPQRIDNAYSGHPFGPWLFGIIVAFRILQGIAVTFGTYATAKSADGIPLDSFTPEAARAVVALFALSGVYRLVMAFLCVVVLVRYRGALPLMYATLALEIVAKLVLLRFVPIPTTGAPPGPAITVILAALLVLGFVLSLWPGKAPSAPRLPPA